MKILLLALIGIVGLSAPSLSIAQEGGSAKPSVVEQQLQAINYQQRGRATKIDFRGTTLLPRARGEAKVKSKKGYIEIEVEFKNLESARKFGSEYLTYVMWAVTPEGRVTNLGEVLLDKPKATSSKLNVTTELQVFGLAVTAEPYFAVTQPSKVVVLVNEARRDTKGKIHWVEAKVELLERGQYDPLANPQSLGIDLKKVPLELYQARNAVHIAKASGAERYARDTFQRAEASLEMAEASLAKKEKRKVVARTARQAVQFAEDARALAVKRQEGERLALERQQAGEREARAEAVADEAVRRRAEEEVRRKAEAERRARAETGKARAELQRLQVEQEKAALRQKLLQQFNTVLETRDTERGLVVNLSDVLFDSAKFTLRPLAREKLARLAGIVLNYPGLTLVAEGHTDSQGTEEFNQQLSEKRSEVVRGYLVAQGIPAESIYSVGRSFSMPVAPDDTPEGRQKNRRVEIIVSGEVIGTAVTEAKSLR